MLAFRRVKEKDKMLSCSSPRIHGSAYSESSKRFGELATNPIEYFEVRKKAAENAVNASTLLKPVEKPVRSPKGSPNSKGKDKVGSPLDSITEAPV